MAAHKWAKEIKAWADGAEIEQHTAMGWMTVGAIPAWSERYEYRIKPVEPERVYPVLMIDGSELEKNFHALCGRGDTSYHDDLQAFGSYILRHAIDAGQVVTREEFDKLASQVKHSFSFVLPSQREDRHARDMAVAGAVLGATMAHLRVRSIYPAINLAAIIAEVKP